MKKFFQLMIVLMIVLVSVGVVFVQAESKTYVVGTSADYPPFEWIDSNGNYVGLDMDLMRVIAVREGYEIEFRDIGFDSLIPALKAGKIDIIAAAMNSTLERAKIVDFTDAYWKADQPIMVKEDSDLNIVTALSQDHKVGAQRGTTQADWIQNNLIDKGVKVKLELYETNDTGVMDLVNGRIDAFICDAPEAKVFSENNPLKMVGVIYTGEEGYIACAVQKGDPKNLLPLLNKGLKEVEGEIKDNLVEAYFAGDLKSIDKAYAENKHFLVEEKDVTAYAEGLAKSMTAK
ncbi:MAG: transporter substrate-binding domain-containing protein [Candidatus Caldatribacteriota bacterium]|nr:transporter substrate-binding domain-containing protein [Candidatus Caldatribacteriota bacterium]